MDLRLSPHLRLLSAAAALLWLALGAGCASAPLTGRIQPEGRRLVLLLDSSTSMRRTDPAQTGPQGAQLVLGLVGSDDNVGVITYAKDATVQRPLQAAGEARGGLAARLASVNRNGITDFGRGLALARDMLVAGRAPPGSTVILLTDGVPYRGRRQRTGEALEPLLSLFAAKGWRIFALALGEEAATPFLSQIVAATGGAVFPVKDAGRLASAFAEVATEALGYLRAERGEAAVEVVPHTGRLAFLVSGQELGVVTGPAEAQPAQPITTAAGDYRVGLIEDPVPGTWQVAAPAGAQVVTLLEPSFGFEFLAAQPPEELGSREEATIAVRLKGSAEGLAKVRGRVTLRARLLLDGERELGGPLTLQRAGEEYRGAFRAPTVAKRSALSVVVEAVVAEGGRTFVLRRTRALTVLPGEGKRAPAPLEIRYTPAELSGVAWGEGAPRASLTLQGDPTRAAQVRTPSGLRELPAGGSLSLEVPLAEGPLRLEAASEEGGRWEASVPRALRRYRLRGAPTQGLVLPTVPAGAPGGSSLAHGLSASPGELELSAEALRGPAGARLPVDLAEGQVRVSPGPELPAGLYRGEVQARIAGEALPARRVPLSVELLPPVQATSPIRLRGRWGWVSVAVEVAWPRGGEVAVEVEPGLLQGREAAIRPEFDLRVRPLDGWDGARLGPTPRRVALSVYLSSDLPAGVYTGALRIKSEAAGALEIPVTLTLER